MEKIGKSKLSDSFTIQSKFKPFINEDFYLAHEPNFVDDFFKGIDPSASSNYLRWNKTFAESIRYTNSSLYHAQKYAVENPNSITFSPISQECLGDYQTTELLLHPSDNGWRASHGGRFRLGKTWVVARPNTSKSFSARLPLRME
jgi:hypothetical protein